jgi:hypothetical protein
MLRGKTGVSNTGIQPGPVTRYVLVLKRCQNCGKFKRTKRAKASEDSKAAPLYYCGQKCSREALKIQNRKFSEKDFALALAKKEHDRKKEEERVKMLFNSSDMPEKPEPKIELP